MVGARCNAYGAENPGGYHDNPLGGMTGQPVWVQPVCHAMAAHRFRWVCEHGHQGPIVGLCEMHWAEFSGRASARFDGGEGYNAQFNGRTMTVPWNLRRDVRVCPACAAEAPSPDRQHKCVVRLVTVS